MAGIKSQGEHFACNCFTEYLCTCVKTKKQLNETPLSMS